MDAAQGQTASPPPDPPQRRAIQVLPDAVINQIAAGEVVDRPSSVVKELLENALDAGATQISVTLEEGGKTRITVLDNGCGMDAADARLAVQRHATSKVREAADLAHIATLGFRGEALASIAAVSRFELVTCAEERAGGLRLALEGGEPAGEGRMGFPQGTKITVEELFYNVPARRKFLRATATEFQHVQSAFVTLALAHPAVHLRLVHNGRPVHDLPRCETLAERVYQLFGKELHEGLVPVSGTSGSVRFAGLVTHPNHSRSSRRWQYLFINGRPIRNAGLNHAVYQAYRTLLMKDRHPAYVLMLELAPEDVDVNVHPAKTEVRLGNPQLVHTVLADYLHKQLRETARQAVFQATAPAGLRGTGFGGQQGLPGLPAAPVPRPDPAFPGPGTQEVRDQAAPPAGGAMSAMPPPQAPFQPAQSAGTRTPAHPPTPHASGSQAATPYAGGDFHFQPLTAGLGPGDAPPETLLDGGMAVLGQFHGTYILVQRGDALLLVDQHAAHERILFERYRAQFYAGDPQGEPYLIPLTLELSPQNAVLLEQYLPQWQRMGFDLEPFGANSFLLRQVPALLAGKDVQALILEVLDELALFGKSGRLEEVFNEILERVACHGAIRAGDTLSREEMAALVGQLEQLDIHLYCPHGRPVWVEFPVRELEKRFKRIV